MSDLSRDDDSLRLLSAETSPCKSLHPNLLSPWPLPALPTLPPSVNRVLPCPGWLRTQTHGLSTHLQCSCPNTAQRKPPPTPRWPLLTWDWPTWFTDPPIVCVGGLPRHSSTCREVPSQRHPLPLCCCSQPPRPSHSGWACMRGRDGHTHPVCSCGPEKVRAS